MTVIVLAGTIGAGKSTLTGYLAKHLNTQPFYEPVGDNPVLPLFYKDPDKYAFLLQIYFLNQRFHTIKQAFYDDNNVLDRSIYEDSLFFHLNADMGRATQQEVDVYDSLLDNMMEELTYEPKKSPDLLVDISVSLPTMLERIKKRGRDYEQLDADPTLLDYYKKLNARYVDWYNDYDASPKMQIDGDKYDFVANKDDLNTVLGLIDDKIKEVRQVQPLPEAK
ncbi:deoxyguanosine kinase [Lactobacillus selangorensis]|uniref:Deoxyguanosine kinase n=1 Tax=Lactobacillus selangorensis TaxID=81857 RepID=A0A0R2FVL2_9LACO|nr:deoxynucleoside kinase [Lactobacillus selangorensis]KRN28925.1 deoxyguanosine kinase [Lactobacillus selangorensis]KRN32665.1 deoxyguanosine kinase [Lactobacillus selangorensis]